MQNIPLSLYIHIPWCIKKCPYCDFNSHTAPNNLPEQSYINALLEDLGLDASLAQGRSIQSIFIGGGTPSLFSPEAISQLLSGVNNIVPIARHAEITLEANPGTVEQQRFNGFKQAGINRLSIGIQSFQDEKLKRLGRIHDAQTATAAVIAAKNAGFDNFNIDLMFGLPDQSQEDALFDLTSAIALEPTHLSWYQLTIEPNTVFYRHTPVLPDDDIIWDMQIKGQLVLAANHHQQYEISAYSLTGTQCLHNLNYWQFGDYLAIGAGAHGKITQLDSGEITRYWKRKLPTSYLDPMKPFTADTKTLSQDDIVLEFMLNHLRLNKPISKTLFENHTGLQWKIISNKLDLAAEQKLLTYNEKQCQTTELGKRFLNELLAIF